MNKKVRLYFGAALAAIALIIWWLLGFDFNVRGIDSALCFISAISAFLTGVTCPLFD
jgi:Mg/Co/Ni transporter MgtE